jgi:VanZ family protein
MDDVQATGSAGLRRASRVLFAGALALVFAGSVARLPAGPDFPLADKLEHAATFFALTVLARFGYPDPRAADRLVPALLAYGMAIELVQALLPWRECSLLDWVADALGIACASFPPLRRRLAGGAGA